MFRATIVRRSRSDRGTVPCLSEGHTYNAYAAGIGGRDILSYKDELHDPPFAPIGCYASAPVTSRKKASPPRHSMPSWALRPSGWRGG